MTLYHYTCDDHHTEIARDDRLLPAIKLANPHTVARLRYNRMTRMTSQLIWLTTMPDVIWLNANAVGLTNQSNLLDCDRTRHRWEIVDNPGAPIESWAWLREVWPRDVVEELESLPGARPHTWWVSRGPLQARYSPHRKAS